MRYPETRFARRLAKRRRALADAMTPKLPPELRHPLGDPRVGEDRRQAERRTEALSGDALDERLRELGISADRRTGDRRQGDRRRR